MERTMGNSSPRRTLLVKTDSTWANVAYRVSEELSEEEREMLTVLAMQYLKKHREKTPWKP